MASNMLFGIKTWEKAIEIAGGRIVKPWGV